MKITFFLSAPFRKIEYIDQLPQVNDEFSAKLNGIKKVEIEINAVSRPDTNNSPKTIIKVSEDNQTYKVKLNFYRLYTGNISLSIPTPAEVYERVSSVLHRISDMRKLA